MSVACLSTAPTCLPDWNGINAVATFLAVLIAIVSTGMAVWLPFQIRLRHRSDTTNEILSAAGDAIDLFREANAKLGHGIVSTAKVKELGATSAFTRVALDRLISREELTDGAVFVGAGSIELLIAVEREAEKYRQVPQSQFAPQIISDLAYHVEVQPVILKRAKEVASYAVKRKWPKWQDRFASIAINGLRPLA